MEDLLCSNFFKDNIHSSTGQEEHSKGEGLLFFLSTYNRQADDTACNFPGSKWGGILIDLLNTYKGAKCYLLFSMVYLQQHLSIYRYIKSGLYHDNERAMVRSQKDRSLPCISCTLGRHYSCEQFGMRKLRYRFGHHVYFFFLISAWELLCGWAFESLLKCMLS